VTAGSLPAAESRIPRTGIRAWGALVYQLLIAARPRQWIKNGLLLVAPLAAGALTTPMTFIRVAIGMVAFCLLCGGAYLFNDARDREADRRHPVKRERPVAAGRVGVDTAVVAGGVLVAGGLGVAAALGLRFLLVAVAYLGLSAAYTLGLKRIPIIDIGAVAGCFVLRALAGGAAAEVPISRWFAVVVCAAALFVVAGKRYSEQRLLGVEAPRARSTLRAYRPPVLRLAWSAAALVAVVAYSLWALAHPDRHADVAWAELSIIPFALGVGRYARRLDEGAGGAPEEIAFGDRPLQLIGAVWAAVFALGIYLGT
jgi:decaprenyl-phosphate phosphoribosyltransferase